MQNISRDTYLAKIHAYFNKPLIKILTGVRRCGKSWLMKQIIELLRAEDIDERQIIYINKELVNFDFIKTYIDLYNFVEEKFSSVSNQKYLFVDEIQNIESWEKTIASFLASGDIDIYITGSNANLLSSEISTLLSGRYIEFQIFPLSFAEFLKFRGAELSYENEFYLWLKFGGFPVIHHLEEEEELIYQYLNSLYSSILLKDVISRYNIRNVPLFENIVGYLFDNIGNIFSGRSIAKYLKSQNISIGQDTLQNYLNYLEKTFIINKIKRYDLKGKKILESFEKFYIIDIGLRNSVIGYKEKDISGILENIIFLKLKQSGYNVFVGKFDDFEIDFVAEKESDRIYIQVCYMLASEDTIEREFRPLKCLNDNFPKYVLSMDKFPKSNNEGIIRMNIIDFLLEFK